MGWRFPSWRALECTLEAGLLFLIVFMPLAFGSVHPWAFSLAGVVAMTLVALVVTIRRAGGRAGFSGSAVIVPLLLLAGVVALQLIPLPPSLLNLVSPVTHKAYNELWDFLGRLGFASRQAWHPITLSPFATREGLLKLLSLIGVIYVVLHLAGSSETRWRRMAYSLVIVGALLSFLGIIQFATWNGKIYWLREVVPHAAPFGPFVNKNHFAGYVGMVVPLGVGLLMKERRPEAQILLLFTLGLMVAGVLFSRSRGGATSMALSLILVGGVALTRGFMRRRAVKLLIVMILGVAIFSLLGARGQGGRPLVPWLETSLASEYRPLVWRDSLTMVGDFPVLGAGVGSFRHLFPSYQAFPTQYTFEYAENDYLQALAEVGVVGLGLLTIAAAILLRRLVPLVQRDVLALGCLGSVAYIAIHSLMDFNLHIPSNAFLLSVITGLALTRRRDSGAANAKPQSKAILVSSIIVAAVFASGFTASLLFSRAERLMKGKGDRPQVASALSPLKWATLLSPGNPRYLQGTGRAYSITSQGVDGGLFAREHLSLAVEKFERAAAAAPVDPFVLTDMGGALFALGRREEALGTLLRAVSLSPRNAYFRLVTAYYQGLTGDRSEALMNLSVGLQQVAEERDVRFKNAYFQPAVELALRLADGDLESVSAVVPLDRDSRLRFATFLSLTGRWEAARGEYEKVLAVSLSRDVALPYFDALLSKKEYGRAMELLEELLRRTPGDQDVRVKLAHLYLNQRQWDRAVELLAPVADEGPGAGLARGYMGLAFLEKGNVREAVVNLEKAVALEPQNPYFFFYLGRAWKLLGSPTGALEGWKKSIAVNRRNSPDLNRLAVASYLSIAREFEADPRRTRGELLDIYRSVLAIDPGNQEALEGVRKAE